MLNLTFQHKVWTNIAVLGEDLQDHHYIALPATTTIRKSVTYLTLMLDEGTGGSIMTHGSVRFMIGLGNLKGLFQPK